MARQVGIPVPTSYQCREGVRACDICAFVEGVIARTPYYLSCEWWMDMAVSGYTVIYHQHTSWNSFAWQAVWYSIYYLPIRLPDGIPLLTGIPLGNLKTSQKMR
jgi:hypothetical protein